MPVNLSTQRTSDEIYYGLFDLTCQKFLVKKEHIDEMRENPKIVEFVLLLLFESNLKSKDDWMSEFVGMLFKKVIAIGQTPMSMEVSCNFSAALIKLYEQAGNEQRKKEAKVAYRVSMLKRNECDPFVTFENKRIRLSKIARFYVNLTMDYEALQKGFDAFQNIVKPSLQTGKKSEEDSKAERLAEKKKEKNRKNRERKKKKKMMARESVQDNSTDNSEIPESSLQNTPTSSEALESAESKISEMVKKLMDYEI